MPLGNGSKVRVDALGSVDPRRSVYFFWHLAREAHWSSKTLETDGNPKGRYLTSTFFFEMSTHETSDVPGGSSYVAFKIGPAIIYQRLHTNQFRPYFLAPTTVAKRLSARGHRADLEPLTAAESAAQHSGNPHALPSAGSSPAAAHYACSLGRPHRSYDVLSRHGVVGYHVRFTCGRSPVRTWMLVR